jgi:YVTN family beta-propeller protein
MRKTASYITAIILLTAFNILSSQTVMPQYRIANRFHLDGDEGWDAISADEPTGRLFVSHGTMVQVVDESNGNLLGTIPDTKGVHDVALADDLNKGFTSNGRDSSVTVFDLQSLKVLDKINIGARNPDAILYDPFTHRVFTFNGGSSNSTVIDAKTDEVIGTIPLNGKPEFAVTDGAGRIYVNLEDKSQIAVIDPSSMQVLNVWSISPGESPTGIALDNESRRLFSVCGNETMVILDAQNGIIITTLPIGEHVDGAGFDKETKRIFSSNGEGTLTVVEEVSSDMYKVLDNITTQRGARTIAVDSKTHHIFLPVAEAGPPPSPTSDNPHPRPKIIPGTFEILDVEPLK